MEEVLCQCGGKLKIDYDETKKNGISIVYYCVECGKLYMLRFVGSKPFGWKTKKLIQDKKEIESIPF